ncbi:MAG TPA: 5'(3')-deoxyribonucleotidase [Dysgonomonas sp.]|nr:5'(3')-deoxyribonucleotidase [Dysgonomonas sp.]
MKLQILVDMDGVLADVYAQFIKMEYEETGVKLKIDDLYGRKEEEVFPSFQRHVRNKGFFAAVPLIKDSVEGLKYLNDKYNVLIVSSATEFPDSLTEKLRWLNINFPFISWQQMIFCGRKDSIVGDIMIDDHPKNLKTFDGRKILFTQPHNANIRDENYERVLTWKDILKLI